MKKPFIWCLFLYIGFSYAFPAALMHLMHAWSHSTQSYEVFVNTHSDIRFYGNVIAKVLVFGIPLYLWRKGWIERRRVSIQSKDVTYILFAFLAKVPIALLLSLLGTWIHSESKANNQVLVEGFVSQFPLLMFVAIVILGPIMEEFVFRKLIIGHLFINKPMWGLLVSSVAFGMIHMMAGFSFVPFLNYSLTGLVLGLVYIRSGRIESPILIHIVTNLIAYLFIIFT